MDTQEFRIARKSVWDTCKELPAGAFHLAFVLHFFETGPMVNWSGLYLAPPVDIAIFTRLPIEAVNAAIDGLERRELITYDKARQLVYVKGLLARQMPRRLSENQARGLVRRVKEFADDSPAVKAFLREHMETPGLAAYLRVGNGDSNGVSNGVSNRVKSEK